MIKYTNGQIISARYPKTKSVMIAVSGNMGCISCMTNVVISILHDLQAALMGLRNHTKNCDKMSSGAKFDQQL